MGMNSRIRVCPLAVLLASSACALPSGDSRIFTRAVRKTPLTFEERRAASGGSVFLAHVAGHALVFAASGTIVERESQAHSPSPKPVLRFLDASPNAQPQAAGPLAGLANYLVGSDRGQWRTGVPLYQRILYRNLYPGIDLIFYGKQDRLEYEFVVAPPATWRSIRLDLPGAQHLEIDGEGNLKSQAASVWVTHAQLKIYQNVPGGRRDVFGRFVLKGGHEVGFDIGPYERGRPLIIDPTLAFASYLGGSGDDYAHAVAVDSSGCAYVVGETGSWNFPTQGPAQQSMAGDTDVFVTKWNAAGTGIVYATYIGGRGRDVATGVAVNAAGNAYVTGFTYSGDFPISGGALRSGFAGASKAFAFKLNPSGNALVYATFLGGSGDDYAAGIAVDSSGEAHIAGYTASVDFPVTQGAFQPYYGGGYYDGFFAKLNAGGSALLYATYLGGMENDTAAGVALDPSGNIYVAGQTQSGNFPTLNPLQSIASENNAFVVKMNPSGQVLYSTYLGGTGLNYGTAIAADAAGNAYVTGFTDAPDFPGTASAYQPGNRGSYDAFVATLNSTGTSVVSATYLGGSGSDIAYGIALDGSGNVYIAGSTYSIDFPAAAAPQSKYGGSGDAFVAEFNHQLTSLAYASYFGGSGNDLAAGIAADSNGNAYITGWTGSGQSSSEIPISTGAFEPVGLGGIDAFLAKFAASGAPISCASSAPQVLTVQAGSTSQLTGDVLVNCTGGTPGTQVTANIQAALNATVAGTQPQLYVGANGNPILGVSSGASAVLFPGISFPAPASSAAITLRITNVLANVASIAAGGQVVMTVTALNANPSFSIVPAQQTVAAAQDPPTPQLQQLVLSKSPAPANCTAPASAAGFNISDAATLAWFEVANVTAGDTARVDWSAPFGGVYQSHSLTASSGGTACLSDSMKISGASKPMAGAWNVNLYWNGALLGTLPFVVSAAGANALIWQNAASCQVNANYYGGPALAGWAELNSGVGSAGWRVVAAADFDGNGVPDLVWQNQSTGQVNVNYYGGTGGAKFTGWAMLNSGAGTSGWKVVGAADFDGNGVPDLIWQNQSTHQVNVNYYGGAGGAKFTGWAMLNNGAGTGGWSVVAACRD